MASVIVVSKTASREVALESAVTVIGRDGGVGLELGDLQVSRRHALLVSAADGYFVKDLGSRNGVLLNKQKLGSRHQATLRNGDVLSMGRTTLVFKDLEVEGVADAPLVSVAVQTVRNAEVARRTPAPEPEVPSNEALPIGDEPAPVEPPTPPRPKRPRRRPASRSDPSIPRAMAPAPPAPVYSGQAEVLALRALLERSDRDRAFFRNLALILFGVLILTIVLVIAWAFVHDEGTAPKDQGAISVPSVGPAPGVARATLSAEAFATHVQPILSERCTSCHEYAGRGGDLLLAKSNDPATLDANLAAVKRFVQAGRPERSPLLLKALDPDDGGQPHEGGALLSMDSDEWRILRDWVNGVPSISVTDGKAATDTEARAADPNAPPTARIAAPGLCVARESIELSATESSDPQGDALTFRWTLIESPAGATASVADATKTLARLTPDVAGRYVIALVVRDPLSATGSAEHTLVVEAPKEDIGQAAKVENAWRSLLGREPTDSERQSLNRLKGLELQAFFLGRDELYQRWWDAELQHLGLTGPHRPKGQPWDGLPGRLKAGRYSVQDAYYALLVGQSWNARYPGREAYVGAVLGRVLGPEKRLDPALREASQRLYDGHESTLLGKRTKGQVGLVRVAVRHPEAKRYLLSRTYRVLMGTEPTPQLLEAALSKLTEDPRAFFGIMVGWACQRL